MSLSSSESDPSKKEGGGTVSGTSDDSNTEETECFVFLMPTLATLVSFKYWLESNKLQRKLVQKSEKECLPSGEKCSLSKEPAPLVPSNYWLESNKLLKKELVQ